MASRLANYLRAQIGQRGWDDSQLADAAGIQRSALSYILNTPDVVPKLQTLDAIAHALDEPLSKLITLCGFSLEGEQAATTINEQIAIMLDTVPELRPLVGDLTQLPVEDLRMVRAYIQGVIQSKKTPV